MWRLRKKYDNIGCDTCVDFRVNRVEIYMLILAENEGNRPRSPLQNKPSGRVPYWIRLGIQELYFPSLILRVQRRVHDLYNITWTHFSQWFFDVYLEKPFFKVLKEANTREKTFQHSVRSGGWGNFGTLAVNSHAKFGGN